MALELENINRRINSEFYITDINLKIPDGHVHAFVGKNAAGKSSLMKLLVGVFPADRGNVYLDGKKIRISSPMEAKARGIIIISQNNEMFENLTVCENIFFNSPEYASKLGVVNRKSIRKKAVEIMSQMGVNLNPDLQVNQLDRSEKQLVMIAGALVSHAKVIILDETSTHLSNEECSLLNRAVNTMKSKGIIFLLVSHRLDQIMEVADSISVMERGAIIRTGPAAEFTRSLLMELITGISIKDLYHKPQVAWGEPVLTLKEVSGQGFKGINLEVLGGQIVALVGGHNSGKQELARLLGGFGGATGVMEVCGKPLHSPTLVEALSAGVSYSQSSGADWKIHWMDRYLETHPIEGDKGMLRAKIALWWAISGKSLSELFSGIMRRNERNNATGGYIQRELTGRALDRRARLYVLCEPTAGLDVSAKMGVYSRLGDKIEAGASVILVTSDMDEARGMSDVIVFMEDGVIVRTLSRTDPDWEDITN